MTQEVSRTGPQEVAKQRRDIATLLEGPELKTAVRAALPKHLTAERFIRVALNATMRNPKLLQCTRESFFKCLLDLSAFGLEADGRRAHLIPFGNECTLIIDYKGLVELVRRSGEVSYIHADVVYENDEWEFSYGSGAVLKHKPNMEDRGERVVAIYSFVKLRDGSEDFMVLNKAEVEAVRKRSRASGNGPWVTDWAEMAKKTAFRRHSKWLPFSPALREAIEHDDDAIEIPKELPGGEVDELDRAQSGNEGLKARLAASPTPEPQEKTVEKVKPEPKAEPKAEPKGEPKRPPAALIQRDTVPADDEGVPGQEVDVKGMLWVKQDNGAWRNMGSVKQSRSFF